MAKAREVRFRVNDVVFRPRLVTLPRECPNCEADLSQDVTEASWLDVTVAGALRDGEFKGGGSTDMGDRYEVRGYECSNCHAQIAFGTERWESAEETPLVVKIAAKAKSFAVEAERRGERRWAKRFSELAAALEKGV